MDSQIKEGIKQFINFCLVGVVGATINYSIFFTLFDIFNIYYLFSSGIGFIISLMVAFSLNKKYTFRVPPNKESGLIGLKYLLVNIFTLFLGLFCLRFFVETLYFNPYLANFFVIGIQTISNFVGSKLFAFK